jgi:hypothetical protein
VRRVGGGGTGGCESIGRIAVVVIFVRSFPSMEEGGWCMMLVGDEWRQKKTEFM